MRSPRLALCILSSLALSGGGVLAQGGGTIENMFGNTVVMTDFEGVVTYNYFNADRTYSLVNERDGTEITGTWEFKDGKFCMTPDNPEADAGCTELGEGREVGESWEQIGVNGQPITLTIKEGR